LETDFLLPFLEFFLVSRGQTERIIRREFRRMKKMVMVRPFRGLRPRKSLVDKVASPPYDVLSTDEARRMASDNPLSFLHIIRAEIDFEESVDPHSDEVYLKGAENLRRLITEGIMRQDETPCLYIYRLCVGDHKQTGVVAGVSVDEYRSGVIKKHERTRPDKEDDRARHIETIGANTGPVLLTYRSSERIDSLVSRICEDEPENDFVADDGVRHTLWVVHEKERLDSLVDAFREVDSLYIADGHHRAAAAARVRELKKAKNPSHTGEEQYNFFLGVLFPHTELRILDYNRVVKDLGGLSEDEFLKRVSERFTVSPTDTPSPEKRHQFGMFLGGRWFRLKAKEGTYSEEDAVGRLDVAILQNNLLRPVLGIEDPRTDKRIDFVGGIRGVEELERRCREDSAVAFALYPTSIEELMDIADAGLSMPPKSTWFEPKLRSGIVVKLLDEK